MANDGDNSAGLLPNNAELNELLLRRAAHLAAVPQIQEVPVETVSVLDFRVGFELMAMETAYVAEVTAFRGATRIPGVPSFVVGALNHRGSVVAVMDLAIMLGQATFRNETADKLIFVKRCDSSSCFLVNEVFDVRGIPRAEFLTPVINRQEPETAFISGVLSSGTSILDPVRLLSDHQFIVDVRVL